MRQLLNCRAIRSVCYILIAALVSTIAPTPLVKPVQAQLMPTYSVGVVEFVNESGVQGDLLARLATDAVVVEMSKTNRYDVSITRSQIKSEMEKLDLRPPLTKLGLVRLGEVLSADAMLQGSIRSVQLSGSGATRRASVTLVVQMIDQASGEIINGAVQTGTSSARVGYTADDDTLITEAINNAAFLVVKTMVDYVIPEATVLMHVGRDEVMLNKGARDGIKAGMRMIVLRRKEIIGYIEVREVTAIDSKAKVVKSMRGIQPEDKARAIFEMPTVSPALKSAPLPSSAPSTGGGKKSSISKIGKFLLGAALVFGLAAIFNSGRGSEDPPSIGTLGPDEITWDPTLYGHGQNVLEYQVLRDDFSDSSTPVKVISDPTAVDLGRTSVKSLYGSSGTISVTYQNLISNPSTTAPSQSTVTLAKEPYGETHTYQVRVLYKTTSGTSGSGNVGENLPPTYYYTGVSNSITITVIDPVHAADIISPSTTDGVVFASRLLETENSDGNFRWTSKRGGDVYVLHIEPIVPNSAPSWSSNPIYTSSAGGQTVELPISDRIVLGNLLAAYDGVRMKWRVDVRNRNDTNQAYYKGDVFEFVVEGMPPGP